MNLIFAHKSMKINLQIERLILQDIKLLPHQRHEIQDIVEAELSRLLAEKGVPSHWQNGVNIPQLPVNLTAINPTNPTQIGQEIAQAIYRGTTP